MSVRQLVLALGTACLLLAPVDAQRGAGPAGGGAPQAAQAAAPVDITGYWVSIVTEDWIERMSPDSPPSGTGGLPRRIYAVTALGRRMFMAWTSGAKQLVPEFGR